MANSNLQILQVNANNSAAAMSLMEKTCEEQHIDLVLIQEPNMRMVATDKYISGIALKTAIYITPNSKIATSRQGKGAGYVWATANGVTFMSCYISPNCSINEYEGYLEDVAQELRHRRGEELIIGGDFNAKSHLWESSTTNTRGEILGELLNTLNLVVLNQGNTPTLRRHNGSSIIDVILATSRISTKIINWRVDEAAENLSDHNNIRFQINSQRTVQDNRPANNGWRITKDGLIQLRELAKDIKINQAPEGSSSEHLTTPIQRLCKAAFRKRRLNRKRPPVHWWCMEVATARQQAIQARRELQRNTRRDPNNQARKNELTNIYKILRKDLRREIHKAKTRAWNALLEEVDNDQWGLGYKIVTNKIQRRNKQITANDTRTQIRILFPERPRLTWEESDEEEEENETPIFTTNEVALAIEKSKNKKAPGPDGIPAEVIKALAGTNIEALQKEYNRLWTKHAFPQTWKLAKLILIEKPSGDNGNPKFRPICLLNTLGKTYERLIKARLEEELETKENLYEHQYGFRSGRSTVDAIGQVLAIVDKINLTSYPCRQFAIMITLDIKNAFNSLRWDVIIDELKRRNISRGLRKTIQAYLTDREATAEHGINFQISCGVPQGSVLGPTLWNIAYDIVLKTQMPAGTTLIAFADDLAVVVQAKTTELIKERATEAVRKITHSLQNIGLELAEQKTEMVLLAGRQKFTHAQLTFGSTTIATKEHIKYLGVHIDKDARMKYHVTVAVQKAEKQVAALSRLMPNIKGPRQGTRKIYASVVRSTILYAAPTWCKALQIQKYEKMVERVNRAVALRTIQAYRTASLEATLVLAGLPPLKLLAEERCRVQQGEEKTAARETTMKLWQERWDKSKNSWTKKLIPKISLWTNREVENSDLEYHTTQVMTGHGVFNHYLHRIGKSISPNCWYCDDEVDDPHHTLLTCQRWESEREEANKKIGTDITQDNLVKLMTENKEKWTIITSFMTNIMKQKQQEENQLQRQQ